MSNSLKNNRWMNSIEPTLEPKWFGPFGTSISTHSPPNTFPPTRRVSHPPWGSRRAGGNCYIHNQQAYCFFQQLPSRRQRQQPAHPPMRCMMCICAYAHFVNGDCVDGSSSKRRDGIPGAELQENHPPLHLYTVHPKISIRTLLAI